MKVHIRANTLKKDAAATAASLAGALAGAGLDVADSLDGADLVIALGGDGTLLDAVRAAGGRPVAGFNIGSLGYLASVERDNFGKAVEMIAKGRFRISERTMLECTVQGDEGGRTATALNDIALVRERSGHAAILDVAVDGRHAARYLADGLIFATPTGSTAYSLSAGGPILMPDSASFAITPLNPHALAIRPIVVGDGVSVTVVSRPRGDGSDGSIAVAADGAGVCGLSPGGRLCVRKAAVRAKIVEFDGHDPYEVLSRKLGWPGRRARPDGRGEDPL